MRVIFLFTTIVFGVGNAWAEGQYAQPLWTYLGPWFGALATFLVVLVALRLHVRVLPPKLRLALRSPDGEVTKVAITREEDGVVVETSVRDARYYHLILTNERPWFVATDVDVYVVSIETKDASGRYAEVWSGSLPIIATHYGTPPSRRLGAASLEYDLCSVVKDKWMELHPRITPNNFPRRSRANEGTIEFRVTFEARSLETASPRAAFEIAWNSQWDDDTQRMRRNMVVKALATPTVNS
jgi:hypothetical protein